MQSRNDTFKYQGGGDEPGPACVKLLTTLKGIQQGKIKDTFGWLENVKETRREDYQSSGGDERINGVVDKLP